MSEDVSLVRVDPDPERETWALYGESDEAWLTARTEAFVDVEQ